MQKRILLLTGAPGVGKTSVILKVVDALKAKGISVGGMVSMEARRNNVRVGFEILDLQGDSRGWLAHVNGLGPSVGKYHVKLPDLENLGVKAINNAAETCQVVAIDEIGPMELFSKPFKKAVEAALNGEKPVVAVVHAKARDSLLVAAKKRPDAEILTVTLDNRNSLADEVVGRVSDLFGLSQ